MVVEHILVTPLQVVESFKRSSIYPAPNPSAQGHITGTAIRRLLFPVQRVGHVSDPRPGPSGDEAPDHHNATGRRTANLLPEQPCHRLQLGRSSRPA